MKPVHYFAVLSLMSSTAFAANVVVNGGFESPVVPVAGTYLLNATPDAWTGTGDLVSQGYAGAVNSGDGNQWLDLNPGTGAGTGMTQNVALTGGVQYAFSFIYNGGGGGSTTQIDFSIASASQTFLSGAVQTGAMNVYGGTPWATYTGSFTPGADTVATLKFLPNGTWSGGFIDAVSIAPAVPEPQSAALALLGLTLLGAVHYAKRQSG